MSDTAISRFWELVFGAIHLSPEAFAQIQRLPLASQAALLVLLMAGLSQAIGQSIVLFINRVKPIRFVLSLLISALLLTVSTGFWIGSTWLVSHFIFNSPASLETVFRTLGLSQAPLIFSFLVALPYLGSPLYALLSLWTLIAFVVGFDLLSGLTLWKTFACGGLGWSVFQGLQHTIGRPAALVGQWVANRTAGVNLVTNVKDVEQLLETRFGGTGGRE